MRARLRVFLAVAAIAGAGILSYATLVEPRRPVLRRLSVPCPGLTAPARLLVFSDVDFPHARAGRALAVRVARESAPDAALIAGDFIDRDASLVDPATLAAGGAWLRTIEAPLRVLAPGEEESARLRELTEAWPHALVTVGENRPVSLSTRGGPIDLFVADVRTDPAPWGIDTRDGRPVLASRGRYATSWTSCEAPGASAWEAREITLAFRIEDRDALVEFRFAWQPSRSSYVGGDGWRLERDAYRPVFSLLPRVGSTHELTGRTRTGYVPEVGIWHRVRIVLDDDGSRTRIRARIWPEGGVEPAFWLVDAVEEGADRRRLGTVGFAGRFGAQSIADLRVVGADGRVLLAEPFSDRARFDAGWTQPSHLAAWLRRPTDRPRLVLSHHPDVVLDLARLGAAPPVLVIAGHTHGGQVRLPGFGPVFTSSRLPRRLAAGLSSWRGIPLFVTVGVGTSVLPVRFLVPPEVAIVTLEPLVR